MTAMIEQRDAILMTRAEARQALLAIGQVTRDYDGSRKDWIALLHAKAKLEAFLRNKSRSIRAEKAT